MYKNRIAGFLLGITAFCMIGAFAYHILNNVLADVYKPTVICIVYKEYTPAYIQSYNIRGILNAY